MLSFTEIPNLAVDTRNDHSQKEKSGEENASPTRLIVAS